MSKIICIYASECRRYKERCDTCKNNEYEPKSDFYKPTTLKRISDWIFIILLIVGFILVTNLAV